MPKAKANKRRGAKRTQPAPGAGIVQKVVKSNGGVGKTLGAIMGAKLGIPPSIGSALGNLAQNAFAKLFGKGDYTGFEVERNSLIIPRHADSVPLLGTEDGSIRVRHREYLQDIKSSGPFVATTIVIQPTNGAMFPWLNNLALVFEQFRILGMIIEYKSISSTAVLSTQALGSVMMATQYNTAVLALNSKRQMLNHYFGCSTVPYRDLIHPIECKESYDPLKVYFTRPPGIEVPNRDNRFEAYGNFTIATEGMPTTAQTVGELWISYDIMLIKPRISTTAQSVLFIDPIGPGPEDEITYIHEDEWPVTPEAISDARLAIALERMARKRAAAATVLPFAGIFPEAVVAASASTAVPMEIDEVKE